MHTHTHSLTQFQLKCKYDSCTHGTNHLFNRFEYIFNFSFKLHLLERKSTQKIHNTCMKYAKKCMQQCSSSRSKSAESAMVCSELAWHYIHNAKHQLIALLRLLLLCFTQKHKHIIVCGLNGDDSSFKNSCNLCDKLSNELLTSVVCLFKCLNIQ